MGPLKGQNFHYGQMRDHNKIGISFGLEPQSSRFLNQIDGVNLSTYTGYVSVTFSKNCFNVSSMYMYLKQERCE